MDRAVVDDYASSLRRDDIIFRGPLIEAETQDEYIEKLRDAFFEDPELFLREYKHQMEISMTPGLDAEYGYMRQYYYPLLHEYKITGKLAVELSPPSLKL